MKNGIPVVIVGKPNSGKSTLLNALLKEERAIVTDIPGTTRDSIEDVLNYKGLIYRFIDTAGLRDTSDIVEELGIKKTIENIEKASVILLVDEVTESPAEINIRAEKIRQIIATSDSRLFILINKIDVANPVTIEKLKKEIILQKEENLHFISAKNRDGLEDLQNLISGIFELERISSEDVIISNIRHYEALKSVSDSLERVLSGLENNIPEDLIAIDIRHAIHFLGEITGEITTDEILGNIFKNFCIGK